MLTSICGINWGDEGKGRMVDLLPSGILREDVVNVMGPGMVIDLKHLCNEIAKLREGGIAVSPENLKISDKAIITMPYNVLQDIMEEDRLTKATGKPYGSTRRGIAPVYADKYMKKAFRMGELLNCELLYRRLPDIVDWKNMTIKAYGFEPVTVEEMKEYFETYGKPLAKYVTDTGSYLDKANAEGKNIMFEAQLGALRDIDYGIVPYTSSSSTIAAYAPIGAGVPNLKLTNSIGIMKAYSSCVGAGPFTCEYFDADAEKLRELGGEYGAATGRPRRVGPFDVVASRYGIRCQGADEIALTKLDVLDGYETIEICTHYELNGKIVDEFPFTDVLDYCKPVFEKVKGWNCDITGCRRKEDLPVEALDYIYLLEKLCGCKIRYVSVGAEREACIKMY